MKYSDEIINAYVDGELEGPEKEQFKQDIKDDAELADQVISLCELKKSLKSTYSQIPLPISGNEHNSSYPVNLKQYAAAVIILCMGYFLGFGVNSALEKNSYVAQDNIVNGVQLTPVSLQQPNKIILHVSSNNSQVLYKTLSEINKILENYDENKLPFELEVVANSGGINLFRKDVSPYKKRIKQIIQTYSNVSFIACTNAIDKMRLKGIEPDLISDTKTGVTAIEQIVKRLQDGWVYIKV